MKKFLTALLPITLFAVLGPVAEASSTIRHSVGAYYRLYGQPWYGSEAGGAQPSYQTSAYASYATVAGGGTYGQMWGEGEAYASTEGDPQFGGAVSYIADNRWDDVLTISSATLPVGTPVMLEVTMNLRSQQSAVGSVDQGVTAWFSCYGTTVFINIQERGSVERQQTGICPTSVGEERSIAGVFYARSGTEAFESSSATPVVVHGSYAAQAWYSIRVLTPGASFSSASGATYVSPVPEPMSSALMLGGLGLLAWRRRERRN